MVTNDKQNFSSVWVKYSDYEIVKVEDKHYITPKEDAKVGMYDPFDVSNELLVDILMIGREVKLDNLEKAGDLVLEFAKKYGLLGFFTYLPLNKDFIIADNVYIKEPNDLGLKPIIPVDEYLNMFLKVPKKQKIKREIKKDGIQLTIENEANPIAFWDKPQEYAVVYSKAYTEQVVGFFSYAEELYATFEALEKLRKRCR